ncbi:MAG: cellulase family glycosylhydrolase [Anaerolineae bacterium]|nr:cellulase family glycosylhydrolase [Anaerolineae bacterium]
MDNPQKITIKGDRFIDPQGRHVLLHGINLVNKDPSAGYLGNQGPELFAAMRDWGFNCVRLGVIWDGLEPEPGVYNEAYLKGIDRQIAWARENELGVFLDMHQDLFSMLFGDGAPEWATLTGDQPHVDLGGVWSDAYFTSPAVQAALDHFWDNVPAPDGLGLQDHYARAWQHLARRYANEPTVIGYDLMNEPFPGSSATSSQYLLFEKGAELMSALDGIERTAEELAAQWLDETGRAQILQRLQDVDLYAQVIDVTRPIYAAFEQNKLMSMYRRVAAAIREVDNRHILFLETSMGSNMGVYSGIQPLVLNGQRDPQQAYAPHGYDLVVDTPSIAQAGPGRVALIFSRHGETAQRLGMPMLIGEWGAYGRHPDTLPAAWHVVHQFEKRLCSNTYWAYEPGIEQFPCFQAIQRPFPERVAGMLSSYCTDPRNGVFECTWTEGGQIAAPSRIYLPDWFTVDATKIELSPVTGGFDFIAIRPGSQSMYLSIPPAAEACTRQLVIRASEAV